MKILITGAKGQIGSQLINIIKKGKTEMGDIPDAVSKAHIIGTGSHDLNITDLNMVKRVIDNFKPDIVINTAAYTNVDGCESDEENAFKVNALGPRNLAIACEKISAKIVHISTDYVFDGNADIPYREYDFAKPQSIYGKSKNAGDNYIKEFSSKYFIIRPSWVYGYNGKNFVFTIINAAKEKGYLKVINDQTGSPTNVEDIAHHLLRLITTEEYGLYHCSSHGQCSRYEFACKIIEFAQINCIVDACTTEEYPSIAKRPVFSCLDNLMLKCTIGDIMRNWEDALYSFIKHTVMYSK